MNATDVLRFFNSSVWTSRMRAFAGRHVSTYRVSDSRELSQVQQVMAGIESNHVRDTFLSALGVNADAFEFSR